MSRFELLALCQRLDDLQRSLTTFHVNAEVSWPDLLEKYNVIAAQFFNMSKTIKQEFEDVSVYPRTLPAAQMAARPEMLSIVPNVFLRSKLPPAVEELQNEMLEDIELPTSDGPAAEEALAEIQAEIAEYDALAERMETFAKEHQNEHNKMLDIIKKAALTSEIAPKTISPAFRVRPQEEAPLEHAILASSRGFGTGNILGEIKSLAQAIASPAGDHGEGVDGSRKRPISEVM